MLNDLDRWKTARIQFDLPSRAANKLETMLFDIRKDLRREVAPYLETYLQWFHLTTTGKTDDIAESAFMAWVALGSVALTALFIILRLLACICPCCKKKPATTQDKKTN